MTYPNRVLGIILVHCTSTTAGLIEYCKDKVNISNLSQR